MLSSLDHLPLVQEDSENLMQEISFYFKLFFFVSPPIIQKSAPYPLSQKVLWNELYVKHTQVNIANCVEADRPLQVS